MQLLLSFDHGGFGFLLRWLVQVSEGSVVQLMLPFDRGADERVRAMLQVRLTACRHPQNSCKGAAPVLACSKLSCLLSGPALLPRGVELSFGCWHCFLA